MPLFEYACRVCGHRFEELVLGSETPSCPHCERSDLEKLHSTFGVGEIAVPALPAGGCGTCGDPRGPGSCSL